MTQGETMQFDLSAVETGTFVFIGTLVFGLLIVGFMMSAAFLAMVLVGVGRFAWFVVAGTLLGTGPRHQPSVGPPGAPRLHR